MPFTPDATYYKPVTTNASSFTAGIVGQDFEIGRFAYIDPDDGTFKRASSTNAAHRPIVGISAGSALTGQVCVFQTSGIVQFFDPAIALGAGFQATGRPIYLDSGGQIQGEVELVANTDYVVLVGFSANRYQFEMNIVDSEILYGP